MWGHLEKVVFLAQIKSNLYPAGVPCLVFYPPPSLPLRGPLSFPDLDSFPPALSPPSLAELVTLELLAVLAGRAGFPCLQRNKMHLSLCICLSLCVCVCVSPSPRVSLLHACPPVAASLPASPPAHPESRSLAVLAPLQDVDVGAGEMALFECLVAGPADVEVDWLCRGRLLQPALLKCKMHFDGRKCKLLLTSVHEDDSGVYTCKLSTAKGNCPLRPRGAAVGAPALEGGDWKCRRWGQNKIM